MPAVSKAFKTFHDFAVADLKEIYGDKLKDAYHLSLTTIQSGVLINDGKANFKFQPFPRVAQLAPTFASVCTHLDGDGIPDLLLAQNFFHPQRETGRMNGSLSIVMLGKGDGTFRPLEPLSSGISLSGDPRSAVITDLDANGRPDILITRNNAYPMTYLNNASGQFYPITLKSAGKLVQPGYGALLTAHYRDGKKESQELRVTGTYLSQGTNKIYLSASEKNPIEKMSITWPSGKTTEHQAPFSEVLYETMQ